MGKQINFLMDLNNECRFKDLVLQEGEILFEGDNPEPISIITLPEKFSSNDWFSVYLYKKEFGELICKKISKGKKYIDSTKSPVIEFIRTVVREDGKEVSRGRLWVEMKYWNKQGEQIEKPKALNDWYTNLCKWIKKQLPKTEISVNNEIYDEYTSTSMKEIVEKGYKIF